MVEDVVGGEPFRGLSPQQRPDQAPGPGRQAFRDDEVAPGYLGEEGRVLRIVEGVSATKDTLLSMDCKLVASIVFTKGRLISNYRF